MYSSKDVVVYGIHGVCKIADIEQRMVDKKVASYYALVPLDQPSSKYYVPVHNAAAVAKLRPVLSSDALLSLLHSEKVRQNVWITDESRRKQQYKALICSGDRAALLSMIHTLYQQKEQQATAGRKFHLCDENFLRDAEKLISSEFAYVLDMSLNQAIAFVRQELVKE